MKKNYLLWIVYVLMLVVTISGAMAIGTDDLVSYYKLDETTGSVLDSHGTNDGTNNGATINQAGQINTAYDFDGSNDYVELFDTNFVQNTGIFTMSVWYKTSDTGSGTLLGVTGTTAEKGFYLIRTPSSNKIVFNGLNGIAGNSVFEAEITSLSSYENSGDWNHLVVVGDGDDVRMYLNGVLRNTPASIGTLSSGASTRNTFIGKHMVGSTNYDFYDGLIDEVAIFDVALSSDEVNALHNSGNGLAYPFTTGPVVTTSAATSVTSVGATLNGDLTDLNGETSVDVSFRYREKDSVEAWTTTTPVAKTTTGTFNEVITGLSYNTEYEYQAVVEWGTTDEAFGALTYFTTLNPTVAQPSITSGTTYDSAYYKGTITIRSAITNFLSTECQYSINDGSSWLSADAISGFCEKTGLTPNANINIKFRARSGSTGAWVTSSTKSYTYDNTAPGSLSFSPNSRDWGNTDAVVMTSAVDSGSGLDKSSIEFCIILNSASCTPDNGLTGTPTFGSGNDIYEFTLSLDGERTICFNVVDNLGTRSSTSCSGVYKIDKTSPTTSGAITSGSAITEGENAGVYFTDVVYTITPSDALSGVASTQYCVDSTNACTPSTAYTTSITINTNGNHYVRFRSTDNAGNVQTTQSSGLIERDDTLVTFFSATLVDAYTSASINNFCMDIRNPSTGTLLDSYCTTTGTITTEYEYAVENYNLSFYNIGGEGTQTHFNFSTIHTINENFAGEAAQAYLDISLFEAVTSNVISGDFNFTIDGGSIISSSSLPLPITSGEFDLVISKTGYEDSTYTVNIDALTTYTLDAFLGDVFLRLDAKELGTNATINTFNGWVYNAEFDYNITFSTTTGVVFVPLKQNLTYEVQGIIPNYATLDSETISINDTQFNYTFIGFRINAIDLVFLNEANKNKIDDREIRLEMIGDYASYNFTTSNGELELSLLEPSGYIMRFFADGFDDGFYFFTVLNQSYSTLNLYMINSSVSDQVTVTIIDEGAKPVEGAVVKSLKYDLATNSYLLMEIRISDFAGETIFNVKKNQEFYKFIVEVDGVAVRTTNPSYITSDNLNIQIVRLGLIGTEFFDLLGITSTITYNNVTNNFRAEYNDANNLGTEYCLRVIRVGRSNEVIGTECSSSSAGTLLLNHEVVQGRIYEAELYLKINPGQTINKFILDLSETFDAGSMGVFLQILLTIFAALVFIYNPSVGAILTPFSLILGRLLGLTTLSWYMITPLLIVGIIIAYLIERR